MFYLQFLGSFAQHAPCATPLPALSFARASFSPALRNKDDSENPTTNHLLQRGLGSDRLIGNWV